jgi:glycosyltransferase involved in cell wall biosynthesis
VKKISIITINLNNAVGLEKTITSVLTQTFTDFEFIIVDGNSTDNSLEIIKKYNQQISFWLSERDNGIYNAMNKGIKIAKGNYLLFLNSGDFLNGKKALENFTNNTNFKGDIIYGDYKFEQGEKIYPDKLTPLFFFKSSLPHQSTFISRRLFEEIGYYNENYKITSDREFFVKCLLSNKYKFSHVQSFLTVFDLHGISNDKSTSDLKIKENKSMLKEHYKVFFDDYVDFLQTKSEIKKFQRKTVKGILNRIKSKINWYVKNFS